MPDPTLESLLDKELTKSGKSFVTVVALRNVAAIRRLLGLTDKSPPGEVVQKLRPHLPAGFMLRSVATSHYVCREGTVEALLLEKLALQKNPLGSKGLLRYLPVTRAVAIPALNRLLAEGRVVCQLNENHDCRLTLAVAPPAVPPLGKGSDGVGDDKLFYQAYQSLGGSKGRGFIFIHLLRQKLAWPAARFDALLRRLLEGDVVEGQQGNPSLLTTAQIEASFVDGQGRLLVTLTWWGDVP